MHELSIALSIIDLASEHAEASHSEIVAVHLRLGPLSGVVREALQSSFELAREQTPLAHARLVIEEVPIIMDCPVCAARTRPVSIQQLVCSICGAPAERIVSGRDLEVSALEVIDAVEHATC